MGDNVWAQLHNNYKELGLDNKPNIFAETAITYLPKQGRLLELGAGLGQDSRFFADQGFEVVATDLEESALESINAKIQPSQNIKTQVVDLRQTLHFEDASFEVVYAHLSLHYFDSATTQNIFNEISRVLKPGGILAFLVNSVNDPEFDTGKKLEDEFYEISEKSKRFFSVESARKFTGQFEVLLLDDQGETYKDRMKGVHNLIRFIGRKPVV